MIEIKKGTLVKAWDYGIEDFAIGRYESYKQAGRYRHVVDNLGVEPFINAIEIPAELAKQLEELGE